MLALQATLLTGYVPTVAMRVILGGSMVHNSESFLGELKNATAAKRR